ncbi:MAG: lipopolysaccharide biosynthesis protein [Pirellulaceae bacterium]|nr:lipopolysaccharide biosynthesis protein [Pirellulaceae bacterium]
MSLPVASQDAATSAPARARGANFAPRASATLWVISGRIGGILATALVAFLLPRSLSPPECGQFLLLQSWLGLAALVAAGGVPLAVVKLLGEGLALGDLPRLRSALGQTLGLTVVISVTIAFATAALLFVWRPATLGDGENSTWLVLFCLALLLIAWQWVLVEAIRGLGELRWASLFAGGQSGGPVATLIFVAALLAMSTTGQVSATMALTIFVGALALSLPLVVACLGLTWQGLAAPQNAPRETRAVPLSATGILSLALPICASQNLAFLTLSADIPIAGFFSDKGDVALLGQTRRLMLVLQLPTQMLVMTMLPAVARLYAEGNLPELERLVRKSTNYSALFTLAAASVMLTAPGLVLGLLFGDFYRQGAPLLVALALGQLVAAHNGMAGYILLMAGRQQTVVLVNAVTAGLMLTVGPLAAYWGGIVGLASASAAILAGQSILEWWSARRLLHISSHVNWGALVRVVEAKSNSKN